MSITLLLIIFTCAVSFWAFNDQRVFNSLKHQPATEHRNGQYYRMLTSGFLHGDFIHLFFNMFVLFEFGRFVEQYFALIIPNQWYKVVYLVVYLFMIVAADIPTYLKQKENPYFASVGASGAVSGIIFMYILLNPWAMLGLFGIIPIPAIIFGGLYLWYSSWASKNSSDLIDHDAHFFGAITGVFILIAINPAVVSTFLNQLINQFPF